MIGAIVGDIVGDIYEFDNIKTKDFPLFGRENSFTACAWRKLCFCGTAPARWRILKIC